MHKRERTAYTRACNRIISLSFLVATATRVSATVASIQSTDRDTCVPSNSLRMISIVKSQRRTGVCVCVRPLPVHVDRLDWKFTERNMKKSNKGKKSSDNLLFVRFLFCLFESTLHFCGAAARMCLYIARIRLRCCKSSTFSPMQRIVNVIMVFLPHKVMHHFRVDCVPRTNHLIGDF